VQAFARTRRLLADRAGSHGNARFGAAVVIIIVMGVSGSGKTTVGHLLAQRLGWPFIEGDDFHPSANISKMHSGKALTDSDRWPWLLAIRTRIQETLETGNHAVLACSALRRAYRDVLHLPATHFVYLRADPELARRRLKSRVGHFFATDLLPSQYSELEEPTDALVIDAANTPDSIVKTIVRSLSLDGHHDELTATEP
jgi:carbohydrate kinase (thermoresistant glucokinase family)